MNGSDSVQMVLGLATVLGAVSMWLLLPAGGMQSRVAGAIVGLVSLVLFASQIPNLAPTAAATESASDDGPSAEALEAQRMAQLANIVFCVLATVTVVSAAGAVTFRNPVYCAIWFGLSLLGTAGLFLFQGAQFLGVATVVVYAGAILVTFLFVLMLAQPTGLARYDRLSWERLLSAATGALMVGILTLTIVNVFQRPGRIELPIVSETERPPVAQVTGLKASPTAKELAEQVLTKAHTARLGGQLFSRHLVAVEVAGTLLLVALVGAIAIAAHAKAQPDLRKPGGQRHG